MARLPRLTLPGYPHHLIQRGNNRQPIFGSDADYRLLLELLEQYARDCKVAIHSYVLMGNHFHLLATPETEKGLPDMMQAIGRRYVRYFNSRHGRSGTLWEGRYRSTLVQAERYLLACMVYIDLNPVRAGMVSEPAQHPWSSFRHYAGIEPDRLVTPHPIFWELGNTPFAREQAYADLIAAGLNRDVQQSLADATHRGWALGDATYLAELQRRSQRRAVPLAAGRPRRVKNLPDLSPIKPTPSEPQK
ncbi:transposase [Ramlibacter tataouinensis]|uniref:transposase n=1 Tax=Ramlibacter tataouinensis TaxID=94132 RepID=UPI0022F3C344|nr:transposase [Ramlibacter tataouinensis]WBY03522.1 transposase [Ramlibacter tataouinensis]